MNSCCLQHVALVDKYFITISINSLLTNWIHRQQSFNSKKYYYFTSFLGSHNMPFFSDGPVLRLMAHGGCPGIAMRILSPATGSVIQTQSLVNTRRLMRAGGREVGDYILYIVQKTDM